MLSRSERNQAKNIMLDAGVWEIGKPEQLASGKIANNKFHMERLKRNNPAGYWQVIGNLVSMLRPYNLDALWYVPDGAEEQGEDAASVLEVPVIHLIKNPETLKKGLKRFQYRSTKDQKLAAKTERQAGTDDVTTEFTSFNGALYLSELPELGEGTVVLSALLGRGLPYYKERVAPLPVELVVEAYVPNILRSHDQFYWQHGKQAVGQLP